MRDSYTGERIVVQDYGKRAPSVFRIRGEQLPIVEQLLEGRDIEFWPDSVYVSVNDQPETIHVNISRNSDPTIVQQLLDTIP